MAKLQTSGDIAGQTTRIALYFGSGVAAGVALANGVVSEDLVAQIPTLIGAAIALGGSLAWWNKAQQTVVTVGGLEESTAPGSNLAAATVAKVIEEVKSKQ